MQADTSEIRWPARARCDATDCARRRIWESRCGEYRVIEARSLFGLPTVYWALVRREAPLRGWDPISRHRRRQRALEACRRHKAE